MARNGAIRGSPWGSNCCQIPQSSTLHFCKWYEGRKSFLEVVPSRAHNLGCEAPSLGGGGCLCKLSMICSSCLMRSRAKFTST